MQQRDCREQVSERASKRYGTGRARSRIRRVNRVRNNNIYKRPQRVYVIDNFRVCDSFAAFRDKLKTMSTYVLGLQKRSFKRPEKSV